MYALYTDYLISEGPNKPKIYHIIKDMQEANLDITIDGDIQHPIGLKTERKVKGMIHLNQLYLTNQILKDLILEGKNVTTKPIPESSSKFLLRHSELETFRGSLYYQ